MKLVGRHLTSQSFNLPSSSFNLFSRWPRPQSHSQSKTKLRNETFDSDFDWEFDWEFLFWFRFRLKFLFDFGWKVFLFEVRRHWTIAPGTNLVKSKPVKWLWFVDKISLELRKQNKTITKQQENNNKIDASGSNDEI